MSKEKILAIYPGHNATVGLFEEGADPVVIQEEKLTNIKNYIGAPEKSISYFSKKLGKGFKDIVSFPNSMENMLFLFLPDKKYFIEEASQGGLRKVWNYLEYKVGWRSPVVKDLMLKIRNYLLEKAVSPKCKKVFEALLNKKFSIEASKIKYIDHHTCHALSPVAFYNLKEKKDKFLLFSMDGAGDMAFAKIFIYDSTNGKDEFSLLSSSGFEASLGLLYSEVTKFLGMKPNEHEYKVMGLAAFVNDPKYYSKAYDKLKDLVWLDKETLTFKSRINLNIAYNYLKDNLIGVRFDNISAAVQKLVENYVNEWIQTAIEKTGIRKIACSGGVFLNVKMNKIILENPAVEEVYFMPSSGDESAVFGASYLQAIEKGINFHSPKSMYLGMEYSGKEAEKFLKEKGYFDKYKVEYVEDIEKITAQLLASK
ncbi:MAG: carbamoyltransferase N-terminal domain-containing protein [Candidatus Omnitrophota bacterium]